MSSGWRKYGLIGYPLGHSFSKNYFTKKFLREGIANTEYHLYELGSADELIHLVESESELYGLNVTIPHKQSVMQFCHKIDETAVKTGAVNCLKIERATTTLKHNQPKIIGYNTDVTGFEKSLRPLLKPYHQKALVLGDGGGSKAVQFVLQKLGISYKMVSRSDTENHLRFDEVTDEIIRQHKLIVNTTPVGMFPNVHEKLHLPYQQLTEEHLLYDLIYNPEITAFLREGVARGATIKNGLEMLTIQAEASWEIWNT